MYSSSQKPTFLSNFKNLLFDRRDDSSPHNRGYRCLLCGDRAVGLALCNGCRAELPALAKTQCTLCAHPLSITGVCGRCIAEPPHFDHVITAYRYAYPLAGMIQACKYGGRLETTKVLADLLLPELPLRPDLIVPMPLSVQRLRERGFNQALEIAHHVALRIPARVDAGICVKIRDTVPQTSLPWKERRKNIRGAFVVQQSLEGLHIAVVDDVLTSGATLNELARCLKKSGAASVTGWVVARTVADHVT